LRVMSERLGGRTVGAWITADKQRQGRGGQQAQSDRRGGAAGGHLMTRMLIRLDAELTDELMSKFPQLIYRPQPTQTTVTGEVEDQEELQGVLNYFSAMGLTVVEVVTIPD
jgi:hypothetical protein